MDEGTDRRRLTGFSLIEVIVVVAIVAILAAVAVPSYTQHLTRTGRADATGFLSEILNEQVRHASQFYAYATDLATLGYGAAPIVSPGGLYTVTLVDAEASRFTLRATPVPTGRQASDEGCTAFSLTSTGAQTSEGDEEECW